MNNSIFVLSSAFMCKFKAYNSESCYKKSKTFVLLQFNFRRTQTQNEYAVCVRYTENITIGGLKFSGTNFEVLSWNFDTEIHSITATICHERA
jgi:hypothetical protein